MKIIGPMAGIGARLRPFTYSKPKGFLKVAGTKVIDHILDLFKEITKENTDLLLVTGYQNKSIKSHLKEEYDKHFNITFQVQEPKGYIGDIPFYGGLGEAIYLSREWYENKIASYDSDNLNDYSIIFLSDMIPLDGFGDIFNVLCGKDLVNPQKDNLADDFKDDDERSKAYRNNSKKVDIEKNEIDGVLGVMLVPKERASSYGIIELDHETGLIKRMVEKPKHFISNLAIAGVYAFKPRAMKRLYEHLENEVEKFKNKKGEAQFTPALQGLIDDGFKLISAEFRKGILDFGKPDTLLEGNRFLLKNRDNVLGGPVSDITNSSLTTPSFIGKDVKIENCIIGPFCSIGDNCILKDCILKNCVIGDNCTLEKIITTNSIIGDFVIMDDLIKDDLIIGDNSNIRSSKSK